MANQKGLTPVHFFSHGSTMMLGEESESANYWKACGDAALANGIEHVIMMGAHWAALGDAIEVSGHPKPGKSPVAYVRPEVYEPYDLNPDLPMSRRVCDILQKAGFKASVNDKFDWIHDTYLILIRMFPGGCPPTTIISMNARYDPHYHMKVGSSLRSLRKERILFIGSGGAVHNLYRNQWAPMIRYRDNFGFSTPPEKWALDFRQEFKNALIGDDLGGNPGRTGGPALRKRVTALMKLPGYRDAHATDDHFMSAMFVAGLCGDWDDVGMYGELGAETWELTNMCNSQFTLGKWVEV
ncbi:extradiol ring-cleavage dioxygenase class iii protein-like protein subunit B [Bisporella sp. PMI_857]|nr:extradiol ring-cleavage dioxygenase class iii protein-like protein subunit B [Bisporella sp. PMI_857]